MTKGVFHLNGHLLTRRGVAMMVMLTILGANRDTVGTRTTERNDDEKAKVEEDHQRRPYHHRPCTCSPWRNTAPIERTRHHLVVVEMAAVVAVAEDDEGSRYG